MSIPTRNSKRRSPTVWPSTGILLILSMTVVAMVSGVSVVQASQSSERSADQAMAEGKKLLSQGSFAQSAVHWMEAARRYEREGNTRQQSRALAYLAYAFQQEGQVRDALAALEVARKLSEQTGDRTQIAAILGQMGNATFALGQKDTAIAHLRKALQLARDEKKSALEASLLNDLGNALTTGPQRSEAIDVFDRSKTLADQTAQPALALTARINRGMAFLADKQFNKAQQQFDLAFQEIGTLSDSHSKVYGYLNIGLGYRDLHPAGKDSSTTKSSAPTTTTDRSLSKPSSVSSPSLNEMGLVQKAKEAFLHAATIADRLGDTRAEAYAKGYVGSLLENQRRYEEALEWTREAMFAAQKAIAEDSLYQWHWQMARLLKATGHIEDALSSYQRAVLILKPIRHEFLVGYQGRHHSFKDSVAPLFMEFEDMLLHRAERSQNDEETQQLLVQVRNVTESSRIAELQDYYRDECVDNARVTRAGNTTIPEHTAVIYPIILHDRLEILVQTGEKLQRVGVPIGADELTQQARDFRDGISNTTSLFFREVAQSLYDSLLKPLQPVLTAHSIHTLIFVPDGPLRAIPIAALHDGKQFAVEQYAIAVTPSIELTDIRSADLSKVGLLSTGLTQAVQGFPALPNVATEIGTLKNLYGGKVLLDNQFLVPSVEREIQRQDVGIVHIASHGKMENEPSQSFLLAYDDKISMNHLSKIVGFLQHRLAPLELLTLSACETAAGDDRAALGLAGVAIKAGARSALATLWPVNDKATSELVAEFYRLIRSESISKAEALRRAQLKIKSTSGYEHPNFWAPFLLIGNWM